jgi:phosphomannomutase
MATISKALMAEKGLRDVSTLDGVRVNFNDDSWILVRKSGTEGKIRVYCEGRSPNRLRQLVRNSTRLIEKAITTAQRSGTKPA